MKTVKLSPPEVKNSDAKLVAKAIKERQLSQGSYLADFESKLQTISGAQTVLTVSSCTTGLQLILAALDLNEGDEVIVPNFTFPATINVVLQERLTPVLADIDPVTYCMDPESFRNVIGPKTKAVIVVHAFGHPADMEPILQIAREHGVQVVEDAACAIGSKIDGQPVGTFGVASSFSFHPRKVITTGEGGAVLTNDDALAERMKVLRTHGGVRGEAYLSFVMAGFNYRMSDVNAALGISQLSRIDKIVGGRRNIAELYAKALAGFDEVEVPQVAQGCTHTFQSYVIRLAEKIDRDRLIQDLRKLGVETTLGTYALSVQPAYKDAARMPVQLSESERAFTQTLALPMSSQLRRRDINRVVDALRSALALQA